MFNNYGFEVFPGNNRPGDRGLPGTQVAPGGRGGNGLFDAETLSLLGGLLFQEVKEGVVGDDIEMLDGFP